MIRPVGTAATQINIPCVISLFQQICFLEDLAIIGQIVTYCTSDGKRKRSALALLLSGTHCRIL